MERDRPKPAALKSQLAQLPAGGLSRLIAREVGLGDTLKPWLE
jgi:hypothetical protein